MNIQKIIYLIVAIPMLIYFLFIHWYFTSTMLIVWSLLVVFDKVIERDKK